MAGISGFDRGKINSLWRLKGKLMLRTYSRESGRMVGAIIALLFLGPLVIAAAVATGFGYMRLPPPWPAQLLGFVLVFLWAIWLVFPIFFSSLNEATDLTHLLIYPLRRRDLIAGLLLGTLFDYPTYLAFPLLLVVLAGWGASGALPLVLLAVFLSYAHMVFIGLLVGTTLGGILQSRRFRDVAIIVTALFGSSCYFLQVGLGRFFENLTRTMTTEEILSVRVLPVLQWFPTGAAAQAIVQATDGQWAASLAWLAYSALLLLLIIWAWWKLFVRLTTGDGYLVGLPPTPPKKEDKRVRPAVQPLWMRFLPPTVGQIALKELKSVWRIPQRRVGLIQGLLAPIFLGGFLLFSNDTNFNDLIGVDFIGLGLPLYALFLFWVTSFNMLGWEGKGLPVLFLTPVSRPRIFYGKGIALYLIAALPFIIVATVMIFVFRDWVPAAGLLTGLLTGLTTVGVTAVFATLFPSPVDQESRSRRSFSLRGGCLSALANLLALVPLIILLALPAAAPLAAAYFLHQPWIVFAALPLSAAYAVFIFLQGCRLSGKLLIDREPEVLAATRVIS